MFSNFKTSELLLKKDVGAHLMLVDAVAQERHLAEVVILLLPARSTASSETSVSAPVTSSGKQSPARGSPVNTR